jgi:hypothetical protein
VPPGRAPCTSPLLQTWDELDPATHIFSFSQLAAPKKCDPEHPLVEDLTLALGGATFKLRLRISSVPGPPRHWQLSPDKGVRLFVGKPLGGRRGAVRCGWLAALLLTRRRAARCGRLAGCARHAVHLLAAREWALGGRPA